MNRYETYKDSGIPWLGEVPEHWNIVGISKLFMLKAGGDLQPDFFSREKDDEHCYAIYTNANDEHAVYGYTSKKRFNADSITVSGRGDIGFAVYRDHDFDAIIRLLVLSPLKKLDCKYYTYSINALLNFKFESSAVAQLSTVQLAQYKLLLPDYEEQTTIAHYLDTKLGEIDALIGKQQTLLEKLAEQRTAVITHAVTKGLNPAAPMKNSGAEWLGEVPAHWETWKITHAIDLIGSGTTPKSDNAEYYDGDILWITTSELRENFISDTKQKVSDSAIKEYSALKIYPVNSVAMAMYGATIGRLGILEREATFNQACCVFGNSKILHYKFLFYWLWHRRPILISLSNGGGQPNLSQDDLRKLKIPIPSYEEQTAIADYLDQETAKIDRLCDTVNQTIGRLKEYRTALITQAVTGKIKVTDE